MPAHPPSPPLELPPPTHLRATRIKKKIIDSHTWKALLPRLESALRSRENKTIALSVKHKDPLVFASRHCRKAPYISVQIDTWGLDVRRVHFVAVKKGSSFRKNEKSGSKKKKTLCLAALELVKQKQKTAAAAAAAA